MTIQHKHLAITALTTAILAGCGGGGSDSSGPSTPMPPVGAPDLQTSVPAPNYSASSQELAAWNVLQQARDACGFGLLVQDSRLDAAAMAHANYLKLNNSLGHSETAGQPGFTGATPRARATAQGFNDEVGESVAGGSDAKSAMIALLSMPYHMRGSLDSYRSMGLSSNGTALVVEHGMGANNSSQKHGSGVVANYPCEGAGNVAAQWGGEVPNPFPDLQPVRGTTVLLKSDRGSTLTISSFSITRVLTGTSLSFRSLTKQNDINGAMQANEFAATPIDPLAVGETYSVSYQGTLDGKAV
ncbi:MAG TPA: CAP domain-containing protein, partial [Ochrobactrum intermedium]